MRSDTLRNFTLGEICAAQGGSIQTGPFGSQLHASDYANDGTPVVMPADIRDGDIVTTSIARVAIEHVHRLSQHQLAVGDIVFSRRGDVTRFARVTANEVGWLCGTGCLKVRVGTGKIASPEWVSLALDLPGVKEWLIRHAVGATMPNLNTTILANLPLQVPDLQSQSTVVETCLNITARIGLARQTNATLESIAQTLFKSWFIDFDPVRAKAEGREPEGMDAETAALFPGEFEESEMGLVPKGWQVGKLGTVLRNIRKQAQPHLIPATTKYIGLEHMPRKSIALTVSATAEKLESGKFWFERDDVLFGKLRPYFHKVGLAPFAGICSTDILVLRPASPSWLGFAMMHASSSPLINYATQFSDGAKMPRIGWKDLANYEIVLPSIALADQFNEITKPLFACIQESVVQINTLSELRYTLLPRLISGKLRLPEAQDLVSA